MMQHRRLVTYRDGRYAAHLVTEPDGRVAWYVWDLREDAPRWLPAAKRDDAPDLDAHIVLKQWMTSFQAEWEAIP